ncbi:MAG: succinate dehydrogenase cytochrome b subunit [Armatimonadetes bacterium]|nr:succinate dehydrogenase cytochrome b subunit [Armatimonadota bacterium]
MLNLAAALRSTVGRKFLMGLTGLVWFSYLIAHLSGNLLLFAGANAFNAYAHFLTNTLLHGAFVWIADSVLVTTLSIHVYTGIGIWLRKGDARPIDYAKHRDAGPPSRKNDASLSMAFTGILILGFIIWHVIQFKFDVDDRYPAYELAGEEVRDVYSLVVTAFQDPMVVGVYVLMMVLIAIHLSHGVWSAFQSLGLNNSRFLPILHVGGALFALVLAAGFLVLPVLVMMNPVYFTVGVP